MSVLFSFINNGEVNTFLLGGGVKTVKAEDLHVRVRLYHGINKKLGIAHGLLIFQVLT